MLLSLFSSVCRTKDNIQNVNNLPQWSRKEHIMKNYDLIKKKNMVGEYEMVILCGITKFKDEFIKI